MAFRFLTFELDIARRELLCDGTPIAISPKALDVLYYLMANHDRLVSKSELMDRFWSARASEAALQKTISQVRKAVGGGTSDASVIKTYHGRGFRFVAALVEVDESSASSASASAKEAAPLALREKRLATVLCARLYAPGTTAPRDDAREAAVARFLARAQLTVDQYQGAFLHTLIDGFTAAFGLDPHNEDGARRAVHCAMALAASDAAEADVNWSFGIESGALAALDGTGNGRLSLPGDIERGAAELAGMSPSGEIVVSATVRDQMRDEIEVANIQNGFRVLSVAPMTAGIPARPRKRPTRFIGRTAEMTFLATQRDMLQDGTGQAMLLSGPAGIGKTRLVSEFLGSIDEAAFRPVKVQCLPTLCNTPLAPIRALCLALFSTPPGGVIRDDTDAALLRELRDDTAGDAPELQLLSDHQRRQRSCALFDRIVNGLGTPRPLVVVFEDVHWLDSTSREYLEALLRQVDRKRLMVVMTTRPSDMPPLTETVLHLSPLNRNESLSLLRDSCDETGIPAEVATTLVERAEGNPFFIEELALAAQTGADPAVDLPTTVHSVIASRIGALAPGLRQLVYLISVIGPPAPLSLIALLLERPADTVERDMLDLVRRGFLQADPAGYGFRHMLINDTAYAMVEESDRRRLHAEIAQYLEDDDRGTTARPERLAWHHQEAGATDQAIQYWIAASRAALHRSARNEAITFAENGLALIDGETREDTRRELDLLLCLAPALIALRGFGAEAVGQAYTQADRLNRRVGNPKSEIRVRVGLWIHTWVRGRLTESLQHADELLELAAQFPDPALALQAHASRGQVLMHLGALAEALGELQRGLAAIGDAPPETVPAQNSAVSCAAYAAWVARMMGRHDDADRLLARSRDLSTLLENPFALAIHHALGTETFMFHGDVDGCLDYADRAIAMSREHDFAFWLGTGLAMRGWALGQQGAFEPAFDALDEGIAVFEATGAGVQLANWHGLRAETLLAAGRFDAAVDTARHALACAERAEDAYFNPRIHTVAALALEHLGDGTAAEKHREQAAGLARRFGMAGQVLEVSGPL